MDIRAATASFERWLGRSTALVRDDLDHKHRKMSSRKKSWPFLRATFYRWIQLWPELCAASAQAPVVLAVGDLHVGNFGTWRDAQGRLAWGVNDFDESYTLPYTNDLTRLAASAVLASSDGVIGVGPKSICRAILDGYREGVDAAARGVATPVVIDEGYQWLAPSVRGEDPERFWDEARRDAREREDRPPPDARRAIAAALPAPVPPCLFASRRAGVGSLGKPRFVGLADWAGGPLLREAKAVAPSACAWALGLPPTSRSHVGPAVAGAVRSPDPWLLVRAGWIARRLAPDCRKLELRRARSRRDEGRLLILMGVETANAHGGRGARAVARDLRRRGQGWLLRDAQAMVRATELDRKRWIAVGARD